MLKKAVNLISKAYDLAETNLDNYLFKSKMDAYDAIDRQSIDYDQEDYNNSQGWRDKPGYVNFDVLKEISYSSSIFTIIDLRRINEIAAFCHPKKGKHDIGFEFVMRDETIPAGEKEKAEMQELVNFINNTGMEKGRDKITKQPKSFEEFIRLIVDDRLRYNQIAFERVPFQYSEKGQFKLHSFYHVPGNSIRYASDKSESKQALKDSIEVTNSDNIDKLKKRIDSFKNDELYYVQVKQGRPIRVFDSNELALIQGNLNADLDNNGYCKGEFELIMGIISSQIFAEIHNKLYFTQGFSNKGILVIKSKMGRKDMQRFKQHFRQQMQSVSNSFRVPIVSNTEIQWVPFQADPKDMEWKEWMYYVIKIMCAAFQISPQEINFDISRDSGAFNDGANRQREIVNMFKETGVRPLLRWIQNFVNREIIKYYNPEYYKKYLFRFVGIDSEQQMAEIERVVKEVQYYKTINEVRRELDLGDIDNGDIILSGTYLQYLGMMQQQQMQQQMGGGMPSFGEEEGDNEEGEEQVDENETKEAVTEENAEKAQEKINNILKKSNKKFKVEWYK